jgi:BlaI family penicillinase repressor
MDSGKGNTKRKNGSGLSELTEAEWEIMKVVWENQPCAAGTVQEALVAKKGWAYSTVKTTMDRMVEKAKGEFRKMLSRAFDGAFTPMMQFLLDSDSLSKDELGQLEAMIKSRKEKTGKKI